MPAVVPRLHDLADHARDELDEQRAWDLEWSCHQGASPANR
jgi:hypothetical protein